MKLIKISAILLSAALLLGGCNQSTGDADTTTPAPNISTSDFSFADAPSTAGGNIGDVTLEKGDIYAVIKIKDYGELTAKLFYDVAPLGVENFVALAQSGYYNGKIIHRVIPDFMFQGGSANGDGMSIESDPSFEVEYNSNMRHFYGALCYANAGGINGSQFYVVNEKNFEDPTANIEASLQQLQANIDELDGLVTAATSDDEREYYQSYLDYYKTMITSYEKQLAAAKDMTDEIRAKYEQVGGTAMLDGGYTVFGQVIGGEEVIDAVSAVECVDDGNGAVSKPAADVVIESVEIFVKD